MVCVDNSEFTRNGDYAPSRFQAQADAVNLLAGAKTQHHPENTVGVLTMAGKTPQVGGSRSRCLATRGFHCTTHTGTAAPLIPKPLAMNGNESDSRPVLVLVAPP